MPTADNGGVRLYYEVLEAEGTPCGSRSGEVSSVLMLMGLGAQLVQWPSGLIDPLRAAGHRVVLLDNRDVGKSSSCPAPAEALARDASPLAKVYGLEDMAEDAVAVLDAAGIRQAHVIGASLGGMIGQVMAIQFPDRVASLVSLMSTTGSSEVPEASPEVVAQLMTRRRTGANALEETVAMYRLLAVFEEDFDEARSRELAALAMSRGGDPRGATRQLAAVLAAKDREPELRILDLPCLVMHGEDDPLIRVQGGERTHACIPNSRFVRIPRMGHYLPQRLIPPIADEILAFLAGTSARDS